MRSRETSPCVSKRVPRRPRCDDPWDDHWSKVGSCWIERRGSSEWFERGTDTTAVLIDAEACTLCLACVSLCPVGALGDNPDKPQVRFQETACLQCGICARTCPEDAITLAPRLNLAKEALAHQVLNEEEPFECIECGAPFGVKSAIEKVVSQLEDKHWMFQGSDNTKLIQMCDDCRIKTQYHQENSPFQMGERPRVRTTEDYLKDRDGE